MSDPKKNLTVAVHNYVLYCDGQVFYESGVSTANPAQFKVILEGCVNWTLFTLFITVAITTQGSAHATF